MRSRVPKALAWAGVSGLLLAGGCAHTGAQDHEARSALLCRQETAERFALIGSTNAEMAACVESTFQATTREVILQSPGGDVAAALDIAERFEGRRLTMRVRRQCSSSCANYFLPLAGRIVIEPGALIVIHGSIDPWTLDRVLKRHAAELRADGVAEGDIPARSETARIKLGAVVERQAAFAERNRIAPGWLLYRTPGSDEVHGLDQQPTSRGRYLLVEEPMMRSCMPGVEIQPFQAELERRWLRSVRRLSLMWTRTVPSGQTVCSTAET